MRVVRAIDDIRKARVELAGPVGLVPTMGFLHDGHLSLIRNARHECVSVIVSIFVNPAQFGPSEDLEGYPRNLERDLEIIRPFTDLVFTPSVESIYPAGCSSYIDVGSVAQRLEGEARPGHFRGVATVVAKLFNLTQPDWAYFGQKDAQQTIVINQMIADLNFPVELKVLPTIRESDGLALSSRNVYLNQEERHGARVLPTALFAIRDRWTAGENNCIRLLKLGQRLIATESMVRLEYLSIADTKTLEELSEIEESALVLLSARVGNARLIDNILLGLEPADLAR